MNVIKDHLATGLALLGANDDQRRLPDRRGPGAHGAVLLRLGNPLRGGEDRSRSGRRIDLFEAIVAKRFY